MTLTIHQSYQTLIMLIYDHTTFWIKVLLFRNKSVAITHPVTDYLSMIYCKINKGSVCLIWLGFFLIEEKKNEATKKPKLYQPSQISVYINICICMQINNPNISFSLHHSVITPVLKADLTVSTYSYCKNTNRLLFRHNKQQFVKLQRKFCIVFKEI